jgi:hypothetical protein
MNHYINQLIMYHEIQQQKRKGKQPSQIASFLGMDTRTTKKYLAMTEQEFDAYQEKLEQRSKRLAPYEDFVHRRLSDCLEASSAPCSAKFPDHSRILRFNREVVEFE